MNRGCEFYADALVDLAARALEEERTAQVEAHVSGCPACQAELAVIHAVRSASVAVPAGLEARIQAAVSDTGGVERTEPEPEGRVVPRAAVPTAGNGSPGWWRAWVLPVAAAAALTLWLGADAMFTEPAGDEAATADVAEYEPFGVWPASDGVVAGELVLSDLSVEELEALLEEMQS